MKENIEGILKNLEDMGKEIGLPKVFIDKTMDKFKVILKEREAENKSKDNYNETDIGDILKKFAISKNIPQINVLEEDSNYIYLIDLPGIHSKEAISIEIKENRILSISAERTKPANLTANESYFGLIERNIELPENYGEILASYENGVLSLMIEKKKETIKKVNII